MSDEPKRSLRSSRLTKREREFLLAYMGGLTEADAYMAMKPGVMKSTANAQGSRYMKRVVEKIGWPALLEAADLGESRLVKELGKRYGAKHTVKVVYENREIDGQVIRQRRAIAAPDERVRMRATQLHALLLGKNKAELDVHHDFVQVIPPPKPNEPHPAGELKSDDN